MIAVMGIQGSAQPKGPQEGRKAAYFARNEAALLKAAQAVLGDRGWVATISDVAKAADVAPSTIYMHFENKEGLFEAALFAGMAEWESWALNQVADLTEPLEQLVAPMRLYVRGGLTHPHLAKMVTKNPSNVSPLALRLGSGLLIQVQGLVASEILTIDHIEKRVSNVMAILSGSLLEQVSNPNAKVEDADLAVQLALPMIGIAEKEAARLMSLPLPHDRGAVNG